MANFNPLPSAANSSIEPAEDKVRKARAWILMNKPFWGSLLMRLIVRQTKNPAKVPTMTTDARFIEWNADFVNRLSQEEVATVLAHETGHCALRHVFRRPTPCDNEVFQDAADHVINLLLVADGFKMPKGDGLAAECCDPEFSSMSLEQVYSVLLARKAAEQAAAEQAAKEAAEKAEKEAAKQPKQSKAKQESDADEGEGESEGERGDPESSDGEAQGEGEGDEGEGEPSDSEGGADDEQQGDESLDRSDQAQGEGEGEGEGEQQESEPSQGGGGGEPSDSDEPSRDPTRGEMVEPGSLGDPSDAQPSEGAGVGEESDEETEGEGSGEGEPDADELPPDGPSDDERMSEAEQSELENEWAEAATTAAQRAAARGQGSKATRRAIIAANAKPMGFDEYVTMFVARLSAPQDSNWARPSRHSQAAGVYLPSAGVPRISALFVAIDTSGSVGAAAFARFVAKLDDIKRDLRPAQIIVVFVDDEVCAEMRFGDYDPIDVPSNGNYGGGGTSFVPAFNRLVEIRDGEGIDIAGALYLTDLDGEGPSAADAVKYDLPPTLWCFDSSSCYSAQERQRLTSAVQFGEVIDMAFN